MHLPSRFVPALFLALPLLAGSPVAGAAPSFDGLWCGTGLLQDYSLKLKQLSSAEVEGTLMRRDRARLIEGSVTGNTLRTAPTKYGSLVLEAAGGELRIMGGDGPLALVRGNAFRRASGAACSS
jgi:hypothetical protein